MSFQSGTSLAAGHNQIILPVLVTITMLCCNGIHDCGRVFLYQIITLVVLGIFEVVSSL